MYGLGSCSKLVFAVAQTPGLRLNGGMTFALHNLQRGFRVDRRAFRALAAGLARTAQEERPPQGAPWRALAVILTDDAGIAPFNQAVMGHTGATDVLTQRYEPVPGEPPGLIGEIVVNVEQAWRTGARLARARPSWSPAHELALYLAHGLDHLSGAADATPAGRDRMRRRELRWLAARIIPRRLLLRAIP